MEFGWKTAIIRFSVVEIVKMEVGKKNKVQQNRNEFVSPGRRSLSELSTMTGEKVRKPFPIVGDTGHRVDRR
jgi:hypothetical protein